MMGMPFLHRRITSERVRLACRHWTNTGAGSGVISGRPAAGPQRLRGEPAVAVAVAGRQGRRGRLCWVTGLGKVHFPFSLLTVTEEGGSLLFS